MNAQKTGAMAELIGAAGLTMIATYTDRNPAMDPDGSKMDNWRCRIRRGRQSMTLTFSKGIGHKGAEPDLAEVLSCLADDAAGFANAQSFEGWADEYGMSADSRKAEKLYKLTERQTDSLKRLLGDELYDRLLWHTDRL